MKKLVLFAGIAGLSLAALAAVASPRGMGKGFGSCAPAALGLTEDQQTRIDAIRDTCSQENEPLRNQLLEKKKKLDALWAEATPDAQEIRALQKEIAAVRDQLQDRRVQCRLDQRAILTPEQQAKFASLRADREEDCNGHGRDCRGQGKGAGDCGDNNCGDKDCGGRGEGNRGGCGEKRCR